jgi:hypothetical protein
MTLKTEVTHLSGIGPARIDLSQTAYLDVSCTRSIGNGLRDIAEDRITFRRWRLGFFVFYGAIISLLGGLAVAVDRPGTFVSAAQHEPAMVSTDVKPRLAQSRSEDR